MTYRRQIEDKFLRVMGFFTRQHFVRQNISYSVYLICSWPAPRRKNARFQLPPKPERLISKPKNELILQFCKIFRFKRAVSTIFPPYIMPHGTNEKNNYILPYPSFKKLESRMCSLGNHRLQIRENSHIGAKPSITDQKAEERRRVREARKKRRDKKKSACFGTSAWTPSWSHLSHSAKKERTKMGWLLQWRCSSTSS